jgi:hypothetical protein
VDHEWHEFEEFEFTDEAATDTSTSSVQVAGYWGVFGGVGELVGRL